VNLPQETVARVRAAVRRDRLLDTATRIIAQPSPTGRAGPAADALADILTADGFTVERPAAGHPDAPAVVVRLASGRPGPTVQFNGHLDTVHLPFVPPAVAGNRLTGSGSCDMKAGIAAAAEALRALRDTEALPAGSVLFTAHDLHEAPWGLGQQIDRLIRDGVVGDAVLIPEYQRDHLPIAGRGAATWRLRLRRPGPPVHEVMRPIDQPDVIGAGADLVQRLRAFDRALGARVDPVAGRETVFVGQIHAGEIYNQFPQECLVEGTRRWLPGVSRAAVEGELREIVASVERDSGATAAWEFTFIRDAFRLDGTHPFVTAFQSVYTSMEGAPLPTGPKPFVDDGNSFWGLAGVPAITHGPRGGGAHTVSEWVEIDELARVANLYALVAVAFCSTPTNGE
jgi:acetylornithine deacetylase/succinyl-diaminopimelate desuccinylase-like protein